MIGEIRVGLKNGLWVFTDEDKDLVDEGLVNGTDDVLDLICDTYHIKNSELSICFSDSTEDFRDRLGVLSLDLLGFDNDGHYYCCSGDACCSDSVIWLCANFLKYFESPPARFFVSVLEIDAVLRAKRELAKLDKRLVYYSHNMTVDLFDGKQYSDCLSFAREFPNIDWLNYHIL